MSKLIYNSDGSVSFGDINAEPGDDDGSLRKSKKGKKRTTTNVANVRVAKQAKNIDNLSVAVCKPNANNTECVRKKNMNKNKGEEKQSNVNLNQYFELPGGYVECVMPKTVPDIITRKIRDYLDIIYGTVIAAASIACLNDVVPAIPFIVCNILRYNNIVFQKIEYYTTRINLYEPIDYLFDINESKLQLIINDSFFKLYLSKRKLTKVNYLSGNIPIEKYNPYKNLFNAANDGIVNAVVLADHVAQHIITDFYHKLHQIEIPPTASMHCGFTKYGTTLHSMFDITETIQKEQISTALKTIDTSFLSQNLFN